ncbi:MAG: hypothetical protein KUG77_16585, partial [Nannocystaceae bacterium]|nr:hypothetical protein [Nannocystaceae bacterium]
HNPSGGGQDSSDHDGPKFDVGGGETGGPIYEPCEGDPKREGGARGELALSYIWIANTSQGTISKINTQTMVEEGRYIAKPLGGDPSRTSVNLHGDVAVANRNGGIAKFWANPEDCQESNGIPGIQTSSGTADILPWGEDECLAWYTELTCGSNRPAAWTRGDYSEATCGYSGAQLWTACDTDVLLLNGETGAIEQTIPGIGSFFYGGAADGEGNFWGLDTGGVGQLLRVDIDDFGVQTWPLGPIGGYGITVGPQGRPWTCGGGGVSRFNLDTETWDSVGAGGIGGCMTDGESVIWHSDGAGLLLGYDIETLQVVSQVQLPEYVHGVSVDFDGYVWGVGFTTTNAYRADPITGDVQTFDQLVGAYTYSDMTGFALNSAGSAPPPEG